MEIQNQIAQLLINTLSPDGAVVHAATDSLDRLSHHPDFAFALLSVAAAGGDNEGQAVAAAAYLKNYIRKNFDASKISKEFRDAFMRTLLRVEPAVLKVLVEGFRVIVGAEFVKDNLWPELIPELESVIRGSDLIIEHGNTEWKTFNALTVLHSLIRPFQYFLNPKVARESVPLQLELIAEKILVPLLPVFHQFVEKALSGRIRSGVETEKIILIISKCMYFAVRSHMPSTLESLLPSLCKDLFAILNSLSFKEEETLKDECMLRLKTGKRSLLIFCSLVTRHRKVSDKLMPDIIKCVTDIVKHSINISKLDLLSERIVSLAFDVISRVLETGPGWRLVSPHFSSLLDTAIFPAVVMNQKDIAEWEEDPEEFIRNNFPSDVGEISGWREDLFSPRKSALNLLGVISISKGPPVVASVLSKRKKGEKNKQKNRSSIGELLVVPFLSKFPIPTDITSVSNIVNNYYGVLMAYGSLVDFLGEQKPGYTTNIIKNRILPLYKSSVFHPYLVATANWVLGQFSSCIPEDMSAEVYSSLLIALASPDMGDISCYPVRMSAAGAIAELVENEYLPPEWLPVLQVIVGRITDEDKDEESSFLFQLLATLVEAGGESVAPHIPHIVPLVIGGIMKYMSTNLGPWSQTIEQGFASLAVMAQCWESSEPEEKSDIGDMWGSGRATISAAFSDLLQHAWLRPVQLEDCETDDSSSPSSCIDDTSTLLSFIVQDVNEEIIIKLKVSELILVWASLIADWHAWEEMEDLSIFSCIKEVVNLNRKFAIKNFIVGDMPSPPAPPVPRPSVIEGITAFISEAFSQYPSAICRASTCVHALLHVPTYSYKSDGVKQSLVRAFSLAAFSHFKEIRSKPCSLWQPLLLAIASCYLCYPDIVEDILQNNEHDGFTVWASALAYVSSSKFEPGLSTESEIKLTVLALAKLVEQLLSVGYQGGNLLGDCFVALVEASVRLKLVQEGNEEEDEDGETDDEDDEDDSEDDSDEDSEDEHEETEEEFLERCAETAAELEDGTFIEEGDPEDHEQEIELGVLNKIDPETELKTLIKRHHQALASLSLPQELITSFLSNFPDFGSSLQHPMQ